IFRSIVLFVEFGLLGRRIGIANRSPTPRLRFRQELQHHLDRVSFAAGSKHKRFAAFLAPIELPFRITNQRVGGFKEPHAGENLAWTEDIYWNRCSSHQSVSSAEGTTPASLSRDACWSAARRSISHHAKPHGPQRFWSRAKRRETARARSSSKDGGPSSQPRLSISGRAWPWCAATTCKTSSFQSSGRALNSEFCSRSGNDPNSWRYPPRTA